MTSADSFKIVELVSEPNILSFSCYKSRPSCTMAEGGCPIAYDWCGLLALASPSWAWATLSRKACMMTPSPQTVLSYSEPPTSTPGTGKMPFYKCHLLFLYYILSSFQWGFYSHLTSLSVTCPLSTGGGVSPLPAALSST